MRLEVDQEGRMLIGCVYSGKCRVTAHGFQTFSRDCQFSGSLSGSYLLDKKDWWRLSDFATVFADHTENLSWVLGAAGLFDSALFELSIEEPLVNLDPSKSCLRHSFLPHFAVKFTFVLLVKIREDFDLFIRFALTVAAALAIVARVVRSHFSEASSRDFRFAASLKGWFFKILCDWLSKRNFIWVW